LRQMIDELKHWFGVRRDNTFIILGFVYRKNFITPKWCGFVGYSSKQERLVWRPRGIFAGPSGSIAPLLAPLEAAYGDKIRTRTSPSRHFQSEARSNGGDTVVHNIERMKKQRVKLYL